ncbi:hypothetical protein ACVWYN_002713 [Pedobacter sp. UYP24]
MIEPQKIMMQTWFQDSHNRVWVILRVNPFSTEPPKEIDMLELGKSESITRPYREIVDLVANGIFKPISR